MRENRPYGSVGGERFSPTQSFIPVMLKLQLEMR